jgi:hypothetical protein
MKCFNHEKNDAVTFCKACNKALCHDCLEDITFGFACKNENCISRAKMINSILSNNAKVMNIANKQTKSVGISGLIVGICFIFFGVLSYFQMPKSFLPYFLGMVGLTILIPNILRLMKRQQYPET